MSGSSLLYIITLIIGGTAAFLSILLWSKTRDGAWMAILSGIVINYAGSVYNMLVQMNIVNTDSILICGIPLTTLIFSVVPTLLFIVGILIMLIRNK